MRCANSTCRKDAQDVSRESLHLLEMELPPDEQVVRADSGFPYPCGAGQILLAVRRVLAALQAQALDCGRTHP